MITHEEARKIVDKINALYKGEIVRIKNEYTEQEIPRRTYICRCLGVELTYKSYCRKCAMRDAEFYYLDNIKRGMPIDIARGILPLDTHTKVIYTSTIEEWNHIIDLRLKGTTGKPHGDIKIIAEKINQIINK